MAIIAAGVTPEILEAAPRVGGFVFVSFSIISFDKLPTFLYSIIFSFIVSYLTIKYFLIYVKNFNLNIFVYYRTFLALILFVIAYS